MFQFDVWGGAGIVSISGAGMRMCRAWLLVGVVAVGQALAAQEAMGKVRLGDGPLPPPLVSEQVPPVYPPLARAARVQGTVVLDVLISRTGDVSDVKPISGPALLTPAAIDAVKQWKYQPYLANGVAFDLTTEVSVTFHLTEEPGKAAVGGVQTEPGKTKAAPILRLRVSSRVAEGIRLKRVKPVYPPEAKKAHVRGTVVLHAIISKEGNVTGLKVVVGPEELSESAIEAVKQWKYKPYLLNGEPVELDTTIEVRYE